MEFSSLRAPNVMFYECDLICWSEIDMPYKLLF